MHTHKYTHRATRSGHSIIILLIFTPLATFQEFLLKLLNIYMRKRIMSHHSPH